MVERGKIDRMFQEEQPDHGLNSGEDHRMLDVRDGDAVADAGRAGLLTRKQHFFERGPLDVLRKR